jgi:hypothetical protein
VGNKVTANYWVFKVKEEVGGIYRRTGTELYEHRMSDGFWAIREDSANEKMAAVLGQLQKDDYVVFYLVEPTREGHFLGTAILASTFEKLDAQQAKRIMHREFLDGDQGVFLKSIEKWVKPLSVESLLGKGAFGDGRAKFGQFFQGSIKKLNSKEEFTTVLHEYKELLDLSSMKQKKKKTSFVRKSKKRYTNS